MPKTIKLTLRIPEEMHETLRRLIYERKLLSIQGAAIEGLEIVIEEADRK